MLAFAHLLAILSTLGPRAVRVSDYYLEFDSFTVMPATTTEVDGICFRVPPVGLVLVSGKVRFVAMCP